MKIVLAGGSGFIGKSLERYFLGKKYNVVILSRNPKSENEIYWDAKSLGTWISEIEGSEVLINLTGKSVDCRYTNKNRELILSSRIESTKVLQLAVNACNNPPKLWLNASSATIYMHAETQKMDEESGILGDDFSTGICRLWEETFFETQSAQIRKVALRMSIVLGNEGGAFPKMKMISRLGLGGSQGSGRQYMSWIHIIDLCNAIDFIIQNQVISGAVNVTAPTPVTNKEFMLSLRNRIGIPFGIDVPVFLLELSSLILRTESELLLKSRNVIPEKLLRNGFSFEFPAAREALNHLIRN